ncbi:MAG: hypothetical protein NC218_08870 [Acetobacter sp.]|nr:hypothetical protein [Acetobacter sp.]
MTKAAAPKNSVAKRAVNKVKQAPQKLVEHTVSTALNTVEKAAVKQAVRSQKATNKKIVKAIKKAEKQALKQPAKSTVAKRAAGKIKAQIKQILAPEKDMAFYYSQKSLVELTVLYAVIAFVVYVVANSLLRCGCLDGHYALFIMLCITMTLTLCALGAAVFVMIFPPRVALVNSKTITIDHNAALFWKDVKLAEEKYTSSISRRRIIALHLRDDAEYPLTFMQKLCKANVFTPFSLPLYAMKDDDVKAIRKLVKKYAKYQDVMDSDND